MGLLLLWDLELDWKILRTFSILIGSHKMLMMKDSYIKSSLLYCWWPQGCFSSSDSQSLQGSSTQKTRHRIVAENKISQYQTVARLFRRRKVSNLAILDYTSCWKTSLGGIALFVLRNNFNIFHIFHDSMVSQF